jgi:hypothetical protein
VKRLWLLLLAIGLTASLATPAAAITRGGVPDGDDHPYVGLMVAKVDGVPSWLCSGALVSETLFVTAGHCTDGASSIELWFEATLEPNRFGFPFVGDVSGTPVTHPQYMDDAFFLYDLGVVELDESFSVSRYAELPEIGAVDQLRPGRKRAVVTAVGYGQQAVKPQPRQDLTRYQADLMVVDTTGVVGLRRYFGIFEGSGSFTVSGDAKHGGTCFGDSGGPVLLEDTILGVISFGLNANCAGIGGVYRIDKQPDLDFIRLPSKHLVASNAR